MWMEADCVGALHEVDLTNPPVRKISNRERKTGKRKALPVPEFTPDRIRLISFCNERGLTLEWRNLGHPVYQLAKITGPDFVIVAYPHTTSAHNQHIRLRDQGSKNPAAYREAVEYLHGLTLDCTFQSKHHSTLRALAQKDRKNVSN